MLKRCLIFVALLLTFETMYAQSTGTDSLPPLAADDLAIDTSIDYDELFDEMEQFMDSILRPRSYLSVTFSLTRGTFAYLSRRPFKIHMVDKTIGSPSIGWFSRFGPGITISGNAINDSGHINLYQFAISPSFDFLRNRKFATGIAYTRYITRDSLDFYVSPLQNEVYTYFVWRKAWLQPGVTATWGWGSSTEYHKQELSYRWLLAYALANRTGRNLLDTLQLLKKTETAIRDFTIAASLRHDFYWRQVFSGKDYIRFTPSMQLSAGTQHFGFNQSSTSNWQVVRSQWLTRAGGRSKTVVQDFDLLSASLYLRGEYTIGKFFVQPQVIFDYYFPASDNNLTTLFTLNTGFYF